jgi:hypothetical protein
MPENFERRSIADFNDVDSQASNRGDAFRLISLL